MSRGRRSLFLAPKFDRHERRIDKAIARAVQPATPSGLGADSSNAGNDGREPRSILGVRNITKSFGPITALKNVSLDVGPGEIRGICGENGAGKSTLVKILTGVYRPDEGSVTIDGSPVNVATPRHARNWESR